MKKLTITTDIKVYLLLLVYATAILFVISPDSYTHNMFGEFDSSTFFMCGKAWMNGMTPYVDFADSKGPLLWLIYGIAYLINDHSFVGVYWLSCFSLSATLYVSYKIGFLLTGDRRKSFAIALLMVFPYFLGFIEMKSELWCQPLVGASLYCLLKEILRPSAKADCTAFVVFGVSFMAAFLIKWSIGVMLLSLPASALYVLYRRRQSPARHILSFLAAAIIVLLPFAAYMLATGCFEAFVNEYFLNTAKTVGGGEKTEFLLSYIPDIKNFLSGASGWFYLLNVAAIYFYYYKHREITILPTLCAIVFIAIAIKHNVGGHYIQASSFFFVFLLTLLVDSVRKEFFTPRKLAVVYFVSMALISTYKIKVSMNRGDLFFQDKWRKEYYDAAYLMSQYKNPTIFYSLIDVGVGLPVNSLPGTTYWIGQMGQTPQMIQSRWKAVEERKPDFIAVQVGDEELKQKVEAAGYQYYMTLFVKWELMLYGRKGLKMPPKNFQVSSMDILLKRKIKFAKED